MRLGFDIDEVVADNVHIMVDLLNGINGTNYCIRDVTEYKLSCVGLREEDSERFFARYAREIFTNAEVAPGAKEYLHKLKNQGFELFFLTARNSCSDIYRITVNWFLDNEIPFDKIQTHVKHKGVSCLENQVELYVDDRHKNVKGVLETGTPCYVMDKPWNCDFDLPRVKHWREIYQRAIQHRLRR